MNKRIVIIFACLLVVLIPVILLSAVFIVRDIDVVGIDGEENIDANKIITDSLIPMNSSIFVLSEKNVMHNIEVANTDIKVVNIERIVPSKVVINVTRRIPMFAIKVKDTSKYALCDRELRVLRVIDSLDDANVVYYDGYVLDEPLASIGKNIISLDHSDIMSSLIEGVIKGFESKGYTKDRFAQMVSEINVDKDNNIAYIHMKKEATIEVAIKIKGVTIDEYVSAGITMFVRDYEADPNSVVGKTYYFDGTKWNKK